MPTIIDALIMTLGLDDREYRQGSGRYVNDQKKMREASKKTNDDMQGGAKRGVEAFSKLRREILSMFAVFTAGVGLKDFVQQTIETDAMVGRLAKNLDMSTEGLSAWQGVLRRSGGTAEDANTGLQALVSGFEQIQLTGQSPLIPYLNLLKISLADLKNPSETLLKMADAFSKMDPKQAVAIGQGMGLSPTMISLLERGRTAVQQMLIEQQKIGVISRDDAEAAMRLQNTLSSLKQSMTSIGRATLTSLEPALRVTASVLTMVGEVAQKNQPIVMGFFFGIAAAALAASLPLAAVVLEALAVAAPFILAGIAIGVFVEAIMAVVSWFSRYIGKNREVRAAMREVMQAASDLGSAIIDDLRPVATTLKPLLDVLQMIGSAIARAFGKGGQVVIQTFAHAVATALKGLANGLRALAALARGDVHGAALALSGQTPAQTAARPAPAPAKPAATPVAANTDVRGASVGTQATAMIKRFEGFLGSAKWDRNAFRAGYGSDTVTDPTTGKVSKITSTSRVSKAEADADLGRRVNSEFMPKVAAAVGSAWSKLSAATQAALTSIAYNYGHLPTNVLRAARTGDPSQIASAIRARASDNEGINAKRRYLEAAAIAPAAANQNLPSSVTPVASVRGLAVGAAVQQAAGVRSSSNQTDVRIDRIEVNTQARDADAIARELGPAIRRRTFVTQSNTGVG